MKWNSNYFCGNISNELSDTAIIEKGGVDYRESLAKSHSHCLLTRSAEDRQSERLREKETMLRRRKDKKRKAER